MSPTSRLATATLLAGRGPLRVLVADDDENDHLLVELAMQECGLDADLAFAVDGASLLSTLEALPLDRVPDIILLDLRMPGLGGHGTLDALQHDPRWANIPVLVFSSSTRRTDRTASFDRGARWFESKPSDFDGLVGLMDSLPQRVHSVSTTRRGNIEASLSR